MRLRKINWILIAIILFMSSVSAEIDNAKYYYVIEENGNTIVGISFYGSGEITIPIQKDVDSMYLEGGLYIMGEDSLTISVGSTESCALIYETSLLTSKTDEKWEFYNDIENQTNKSVIITLPLNAVIEDTNPEALVESNKFIKLNFDNPDSLEVSFHFPVDLPPSDDGNGGGGGGGGSIGEVNNNTEIEDTIEEVINDTYDNDNDPEITIEIKEPNGTPLNTTQAISNNRNNNLLYVFFVTLAIALAIFSFSYKYYYIKRKQITPGQVQLLQTLTDNESNLISELLKHKGSVKRSRISKKLDLAKSSIAATINNLERKKILYVDREFNSHNIKLSEWFRKL